MRGSQDCVQRVRFASIARPVVAQIFSTLYFIVPPFFHDFFDRIVDEFPEKRKKFAWATKKVFFKHDFCSFRACVLRNSFRDFPPSLISCNCLRTQDTPQLLNVHNMTFLFSLNYPKRLTLYTSCSKIIDLDQENRKSFFGRWGGLEPPSLLETTVFNNTASCWYDPPFQLYHNWRLGELSSIIIPSNVLPSSKLSPIVFKHIVFKQGALILWSLPPDPFKGGVPQTLYRNFAVCAHQNFLKNNQWRKLYSYEFTLSTRKNFIILLCCFFATGFFFSASATSWK